MGETAQIIETLAAGLFAGAAIYISGAEHPARMECGVELAATVFGPSYRRAAVMQAGLARCVVGRVAELSPGVTSLVRGVEVDNLVVGIDAGQWLLLRNRKSAHHQ